MAEKKYYWLKMTDQFFEDKAIKKLRKIAGGDTYTIIYLKMLLTAIKQGNKMYFEGIEDDFMEELARRSNKIDFLSCEGNSKLSEKQGPDRSSWSRRNIADAMR